jgi:hypothetical protein
VSPKFPNSLFERPQILLGKVGDNFQIVGAGLGTKTRGTGNPGDAEGGQSAAFAAPQHLFMDIPNAVPTNTHISSSATIGVTNKLK